MQIGLYWTPESMDSYAELARESEATGIDFLGVSDSQAGLYRECYVALATVVQNTHRVIAGPTTTNPVTRHPAVMAAAMSTLDEQSGGRCILGIGPGESAVSNLGLRPATLAALAEYVAALRGLFSGQDTIYQGRTIRLRWASRQIPIYLGAHGPKSLRLAGRIADGVIVGGGLLPEVVDAALGFIHEGANSVGRDASKIDVWFVGTAAIADSREEAVHLVRGRLAGAAKTVFRSTLEGKAVPDEFVKPIQELQLRYDVRYHNVPGEQNANADLIDELGLTDYLAQRFGILGTVEDCIGQLRHVQARRIDGVLAAGPLMADKREFLRGWKTVVATVRRS